MGALKELTEGCTVLQRQAGGDCQSDWAGTEARRGRNAQSQG